MRMLTKLGLRSISLFVRTRIDAIFPEIGKKRNNIILIFGNSFAVSRNKKLEINVIKSSVL